MRGGGLGGPLLCIGDLLNDVGEDDTTTAAATAIATAIATATATATESVTDSRRSSPTPVGAADLTNHQIHPSDLTKLYEESYKRLNDALDGTSHSWTAHTLELCSALETANKLIQSSDSHVIEVSKKIRELETVTKKGNLVIKQAEFLHTYTNHD